MNYLNINYRSSPDDYLLKQIEEFSSPDHKEYNRRFLIIGQIAREFEKTGQSTPLTRVCRAVEASRYGLPATHIQQTDLENIPVPTLKVLQLAQPFFSPGHRNFS